MTQEPTRTTQPPDKGYQGGCLCGKIRFAIDAPLESVLNCHCSFCRKTHGSAFATYGRLERDAFHWLRGEENLGRYDSSPGFTRYFCCTCGSVMPIADPTAAFAFVPAGSLDNEGSASPLAHIFTASKAGWHSIEDALPQFETWPPGVERVIAKSTERNTSHTAPDMTSQENTGAHSDRTPGITRGSCLCNGVTFSFQNPPQSMRNCHCSRCRKSRSAAHASNLFVHTEKFQWHTGEALICRFDLPEADRFGANFCRHCGSCVPRTLTAFDSMNIPAGCLDDDPGMSPQMHIFTASKAPWFDIADALPRYETYPTEPDPIGTDASTDS